MGWFGTTLGIMGGIARGATAASLWTGNQIYTGLSFPKNIIKGIHETISTIKTIPQITNN